MMAERRKPELPPIVLASGGGGGSAGKDSSTKVLSGQFLTVDETKRPRANSDPVGLHFAISILPEITVTADDGDDNGSNDDDEVDAFLVPPSPRPRANTCPEDMFQQRKERPPTPPPSDIVKSPVKGKKRLNFFNNTKELNGISFVHHKLCKVSEDGSSGSGGSGLSSHRSNGHRRHSTGRRASCLASLTESNSMLEEEENENDDALGQSAPMILSHSMNSLSLSSDSMKLSENVDKQEGSAFSDGQSVNNNNNNIHQHNNGSSKTSSILLNTKCSVGVENMDCESKRHNVIASASSSSVR